MTEEENKPTSKKKGLLARAASSFKKSLGVHPGHGEKAARPPAKKREAVRPSKKAQKSSSRAKPQDQEMTPPQKNTPLPAAAPQATPTLPTNEATVGIAIGNGRPNHQDPTAQSLPQDPVLDLSQDDIDTSRNLKFTLERANHKHSTPAPLQTPEYENLGELPEAYGTKKLYLVARDPHWLYAYWDLTPEQIGQAERQAHDGKVFLQLYGNHAERLQQIHISPWTREWYLGALRPDHTFYAELGYYRTDGHFEVLTRSQTIASPRNSMSWRSQARFATLPFHFSFSNLTGIIRSHAQPGEDLAETMARLQAGDFPWPFAVDARLRIADGSPDHLLDYVNRDMVRRIRMGSAEITEIFHRRKEGASAFEYDMSSGQWSSPSSPFGASFGAAGRGFHAHVNAELILYGGTEPTAQVQVNGRPIQLDANGNFRYHFNYQDGQYQIPIEITSADGQERRSVLLSFLRITDTVGQVAPTSQEPRPTPPGKLD